MEWWMSDNERWTKNEQDKICEWKEGKKNLIEKEMEWNIGHLKINK